MFLVAWLQQAVYSGLYSQALIISKGVFYEAVDTKNYAF
jgi:hypothetical protein